MELQSRYSELQAAGVGLASIIYEPVETLKGYADARGIQFPLLSDEGSETIKRYDLLNREVDPTSRSYGVPYPGTFILDTSGRVIERFFEQRLQERFTVSSIAVRLGDILGADGRDGTRVETNHLEALAFSTDGTVAPGNRFSLVVDVTPKPEMHVYAPGNHTYRVIRLRLDGPAFVQAHEVAYPPSEVYHFEPLDERVPVYMKPFRLVQDVTIPMSQDIAALAAEPGATLTIDGVLEYQACDDAICYTPAEVPLTWDFTWRSLVRD